MPLPAISALAPLALKAVPTIIGGIAGLVQESPQAKAAREAARRIEENAMMLERRAERQMNEADAFGRRVESRRGFQAGAAATRANQEAVGLYDRLLARQRGLQSAAISAARAGLNVNFNPALTETFGQVGQAGAAIEGVRAQALADNENRALQGQAQAQQMRQRADDLALQAANLRARAQEYRVQGEKQGTGLARFATGALLGSQFGKAGLDLFDSMGGSQGIANTFGNLFGGGQEPLALAQARESAARGEIISTDVFMPPSYLEYDTTGGGQTTFDNNQRAFLYNQVLYDNAMQDYARRYGIERRAMGGKVKEGQPYLVGDSPDGVPTGNEEIFVPEQDGTIIPSVNTQAMMQEQTMQGQPITPYQDYLAMIEEEARAMEQDELGLAAILLKGTGLESLISEKRRTRRAKAMKSI